MYDVLTRWQSFSERTSPLTISTKQRLIESQVTIQMHSNQQIIITQIRICSVNVFGQPDWMCVSRNECKWALTLQQQHSLDVSSDVQNVHISFGTVPGPIAAQQPSVCETDCIITRTQNTSIAPTTVVYWTYYNKTTSRTIPYDQRLKCWRVRRLCWSVGWSVGRCSSTRMLFKAFRTSEKQRFEIHKHTNTHTHTPPPPHTHD